MAINEHRLNRALNAMKKDLHYTGKDLDRIWGVTENMRKKMLSDLRCQGLISSTGVTSSVRYFLTEQSTPAEAPPATPLNDLIAAATNIGTENEKFKRALREIYTSLSKVVGDL